MAPLPRCDECNRPYHLCVCPPRFHDIPVTAEELRLRDALLPHSKRLKEAPMAIREGTLHTGNKYLREIFARDGQSAIIVDVYGVLEAYGVTCPARQHAIKKLLCAGLRGKGSQVDDLTEARDAITRAIELQRTREAG